MSDSFDCNAGAGRGRRDTVLFSGYGDMDRETIREVSRVTWVGVAVNVGLAVLKTVGGILGHSTALLADAVHTVSDLATDAAVLIGVRYWTAPADAEHPHGHRKIETLVTLAIGVALAAVGVVMGWNSVTDLIRIVAERAFPPAGAMGAASWLALGAALLSIVFKELLYRWTARKGIALESSAVVANAWHHRSDALSSIPPALAIAGQGIGGRYGHDLWYLDSIGTLVVCVMLLQAAWEVVKPTLSSLLDESADRKLCSAIRRTVLTTPGVIDTHRIRTRVIGANAVAVDLHVFVDRDLTVLEGHAIAAKVKYAILRLGADASARPVDVMVHVEPAAPEWARNLAGGECGKSDTMVDWKVKPPISN